MTNNAETVFVSPFKETANDVQENLFREHLELSSDVCGRSTSICEENAPVQQFQPLEEDQKDGVKLQSPNDINAEESAIVFVQETVLFKKLYCSNILSFQMINGLV